MGHLSLSNATCAHNPKESHESFFNYYMQHFSPQNWMSPLSQNMELMPETDNTLLHSHASFALTQKHSFLQEKIVKAKWLLVCLWSSSWGMLEHSWILAEVLADINCLILIPTTQHPMIKPWGPFLEEHEDNLKEEIREAQRIQKNLIDQRKRVVSLQVSKLTLLNYDWFLQ